MNMNSKLFQKYKNKACRAAIELGLKAIPLIFEKDPTYLVSALEKIQSFAETYTDLSDALLTQGRSHYDRLHNMDAGESIGLLEFLITHSSPTSTLSSDCIDKGIGRVLPLATIDAAEAVHLIDFLGHSTALSKQQEKNLVDQAIHSFDVIAKQNPWEIKSLIKAVTSDAVCQTMKDSKGEIISKALSLLPLLTEKAPTEGESLMKVVFEALDLDEKELKKAPLYGRLKTQDGNESVVVVSGPIGPFKNICFATVQENENVASAVYQKAFFKGTARELADIMPPEHKADARAFTAFAAPICSRPIVQLPKLSEALCMRSLERKMTAYQMN